MKSKILSKLIYVVCVSGFIQLPVHSAELITAEQLVKQLNAAPSRSMGGQAFGTKKGRANMSAIQFEYNSAQLLDSGRKQVDELAMAIKMLDTDSFQIIGHTDASGSDKYNQTLSQRRANTVYSYLIETHGISSSRLNAVGKGEDALIDSQNPNAAENRRVEAVNTRVLQ